MKELWKNFPEEVASRNAFKKCTAGVPSDSDGGLTSCSHERSISLGSLGLGYHQTLNPKSQLHEGALEKFPRGSGITESFQKVHSPSAKWFWWRVDKLQSRKINLPGMQTSTQTKQHTNKQSNHQTITQSNNQTSKQSNNETMKQSSTQTNTHTIKQSNQQTSKHTNEQFRA